ncbi:MAG TPA: glutamate--tRNA ligase [Candidatus Obscuribacterales bacterium]
MSHDKSIVRTRFAPSPTGLLHIGSLRTVIFAWLWARHCGGQFVLRIEDTDRKRLVEGAVEQIIDALRLCGLNWDEGPDIGGPHAPYTQSERLALYRKHADDLLARGHLYKCFCTAESLAQRAKEREERKETPGYDRRCRNLSHKQVACLEAAGAPYTFRLKMPLTGETVVNDIVRGPIAFQNALQQDLVMIKSDGYPTYHFAVVVDDHEMNITHVIRADEWLPTAPVHVTLYKLFGWEEPSWVHVAPVKGKDGKKKLSKRDGDTSVTEYLDKGYLPEALVNFLSLIGWSPGDDREIMTERELIEAFTLDRLLASGGVFNIEKLNHFNGVYIRALPDSELARRLLPFLARAELIGAEPGDAAMRTINALAPLLKQRLIVLPDAIPLVTPFFRKPALGGAEQLLPKGKDADYALRALSAARTQLDSLLPFDAPSIESALRTLAAQDSMGKHVLSVLRLAITGAPVSLPLFESLAILGKDETLLRIDAAIGLLNRSAH